jgi:hypothetical protein
MADFFLRLQGSTLAELPNAPSNLLATDVANREFILSWQNNTIIGDNNLIQKWNETLLKWETLFTVDMDDSEKKVTGLLPNEAMRMRVAVYLQANDSYFPSQILDVTTTNTAEPVPSDVSVDEIDYESGMLTWVNNPIQGMGINNVVKLYSDGSLISTTVLPLTADELELTGLTQNTIYSAVVCVRDNISDVQYDYCATQEIFATDNLDFENLTATVGAFALKLDWETNLTVDDDEYKIYVAISTTTEFIELIEIGLTDETHIFTGLTANQLYHYKTIVADAVTEDIIYSETGSATTLTTAAITPSSVLRTTTAFPDAEVYTTFVNNNTIDDYNLYVATKVIDTDDSTYEYAELSYDTTGVTVNTYSGSTLIPYGEYTINIFAAHSADISTAIWSIGGGVTIGSWLVLRPTSPVFVSKSDTGITYTWTNNDIYTAYGWDSDDYQKVAYVKKQDNTFIYKGLIDFTASGHTWSGLTENTFYGVFIYIFPKDTDYENRAKAKTSTFIGNQTTSMGELLPIDISDYYIAAAEEGQATRLYVVIDNPNDVNTLQGSYEFTLGENCVDLTHTGGFTYGTITGQTNVYFSTEEDCINANANDWFAYGSGYTLNLTYTDKFYRTVSATTVVNISAPVVNPLVAYFNFDDSNLASSIGYAVLTCPYPERLVYDDAYGVKGKGITTDSAVSTTTTALVLQNSDFDITGNKSFSACGWLYKGHSSFLHLNHDTNANQISVNSTTGIVTWKFKNVTIGATHTLSTLTAWHFYAVTYDSATGDAKLYIDNVEIYSTNDSNEITNANAISPLFLNVRQDGIGTNVPMVDEVRLYLDKVLTTEEMTVLYNDIDE